MKKAKQPAKKELRPASEGAGTIQEETADGQVAQSGTKPPEKGSNAPSVGEKMLQNGTSVPEKGQNVAQSGKHEPSDTSASASGTAPSTPGSENGQQTAPDDAAAQPSTPAPAPDSPSPRQKRKARRILHRAHKKEEAAQRKAQRLLWEEERDQQIREVRSRKPDIRGRMAARIYRQRKRQGRKLGTPDLRKAGFPRKKRPLRQAGMVFLCLLLLAGSAAFYVLDVPNWQRLDIRKITAAPQTGRMFDNQGQLIATIRGSQNRVVIPLEQIPQQIRDVFIAAEDLRFYQHHGVDLVRLFGALAANIREGSYAQGGSTITMQLIRQSHLSTRKTIARKAEEIALALQLEARMSKDEILAMYLNYIYFGNGAYGIQAAARTYFDVDAADLTLAQTASLAAAIKAPSYYAPHANKANNLRRRSYILSTMLAQGMITQEAYNEANAEELVLADAPPQELTYGWFVDAALTEAEQILGLSSDQVLTGGFTIETTLSRTHQDTLDAQFTKDLFPAKASDGTPVQGAAACVDVRTGQVLAIVGGREYQVRRGFNRATDLRRQPGSALKPLVAYAPAIDRYGYMTASVLKDEPTNFGGYKPRNASYTYYGNVSMRTALQNSLNVSTVALMNDIGVPAGREYLEKVGIPLDNRDSNLALALGAMTYGVSPVQLAAAYAPFANGGSFHQPHMILRITGPSGQVLYQHRQNGTQVLKATSAYLMTSLLQSVTSSGTGAKLSAAGTPVAGKTGTVNMTGGGNRDIWMACYNSEIACAFWMGFDEPDQNHKLAGWVSGGDNTAAMARDFFRALYKDRDKPQFTRPNGIISLEIDKQAIKWRGEPMLAVDLTPKKYRYTEYFTEDNHPTKKSDVWTPPRSPNRFSVGHSDSGYPLLIIQPADEAIYRVQRDAYGESFVLTELYGTPGETLYYTDTAAKPGVMYTYRVIPVHAELLNNGILLEGVQAVQVGQSKHAANGSLWDSLRDLFRSRDDDEDDEDDVDVVESMTENQTSIFWPGWTSSTP